MLKEVVIIRDKLWFIIVCICCKTVAKFVLHTCKIEINTNIFCLVEHNEMQVLEVTISNYYFNDTIICQCNTKSALYFLIISILLGIHIMYQFLHTYAIVIS